MRWFYWGQPGAFWVDMAKNNCPYFCADKESIAKAENIVTSWQEKSLPKDVRLTLATYAANGNVLGQNWDKVIDEYNKLKSHYKGEVPWSIANLASRAYAECGNFGESYKALEQSTIASCRVAYGILELVFLPLFALAGDENKLVAILERLKAKGSVLPAVSRHYWHARCLMASAKTEVARKALLDARSFAPPGQSGLVETDRQSAGKD